MYGGGIPIYRSNLTFQRGHGLGSLLAKAVSGIIPLFSRKIVRKGLKRLGTAALSGGIEAASTALNNRDTSFTQALKQSSKKQANQLLAEARAGMMNQRKRKHPQSMSTTISNKRRRTLPDTIRRVPTLARTKRVRSRQDIFDTI